MKKLPLKWPTFEKQLFVSPLSCPNCETNIFGNYSLTILLQLSSEDQYFIFDFILSS
jgi:hypothetical protein